MLFVLEELPAVVFITVHMVVVFHYISLLCCSWEAKVLFYHFFHNSSVWSLRHEAAQYDHKTLIQYSIDALTLLKLQVFLGKESLQCGHILSPRMFKSWDRSSVQTSCAGVFFSLCLSLVSLFSLSLLSSSSTYQLKESKRCINNPI